MKLSSILSMSSCLFVMFVQSANAAPARHLPPQSASAEDCSSALKLKPEFDALAELAESRPNGVFQYGEKAKFLKDLKSKGKEVLESLNQFLSTVNSDFLYYELSALSHEGYFFSIEASHGDFDPSDLFLSNVDWKIARSAKETLLRYNYIMRITCSAE